MAVAVAVAVTEVEAMVAAVIGVGVNPSANGRNKIKQIFRKIVMFTTIANTNYSLLKC